MKYALMANYLPKYPKEWARWTEGSKIIILGPNRTDTPGWFRVQLVHPALNQQTLRTVRAEQLDRVRICLIHDHYRTAGFLTWHTFAEAEEKSKDVIARHITPYVEKASKKGSLPT